MEARWYIHRDGEQVGPLTAAEIRNGLREGSVDPFDLVAREGSNLRVELVEVDEIFVNERNESSTKINIDSSERQLETQSNGFGAAANEARTRISLIKNVPETRVETTQVPVAEAVIAEVPRLKTEVLVQSGVNLKSPVELQSKQEGQKRATPASIREPKRYHLMNKQGRFVGPLSAKEVVALFFKGTVDRSFFVVKNNAKTPVSIEKFVMVYARQENGRRKPSFEIAEPSRFNSFEPRDGSPFRRVVDTGQILAKAYLERERLTRLAYTIAFLLIFAAIGIALYTARVDLKERLAPLLKVWRAKIEQKVDQSLETEWIKRRYKSQPDPARLDLNSASQKERLERESLQQREQRNRVTPKKTDSSSKISAKGLANAPQLQTLPIVKSRNSLGALQRDESVARRSPQEALPRNRSLAIVSKPRAKLRQEVRRQEREPIGPIRRQVPRRPPEQERAVNLVRTRVNKQRQATPRISATPPVGVQRAVAITQARSPARPPAQPQALPAKKPAGLQVDGLLDGQQVVKLGPMRFDPAQIQACEAACSVMFRGAGGSLQVKFFKGVWGPALLSKSGGVYVSGLVRKGAAGSTLLLSDVQ